MEASVAVPQVHELGEGPTWDDQHQVAHWVDIDRGLLFEGVLADGSLEAGVVHRREPALAAGVHTTEGGFLLATTSALVHRREDGTERTVVRLVPEGVASRLNDGAVDPAGRYLVGSMSLDDRTGQERLWRLEPTGEVTVLDEGLTVSNGLGWSPDGSLLYSTDTFQRTVWVRDYDPGSAQVGGRRAFLTFDAELPDGLTVDASGHVWVALWASGSVRCFAPSGAQVEEVRVGAPLTTSCAFIGPDLSTLLITSASTPEPGVPAGPDAGKVFTVDLPGPGLPTPAWRPVPPP